MCLCVCRGTGMPVPYGIQIPQPTLCCPVLLSRAVPTIGTMVCQNHTCVFLLPSLHCIPQEVGWRAAFVWPAALTLASAVALAGYLHATRKTHCRQCFCPQIIACHHRSGEQQSDGCVSV